MSPSLTFYKGAFELEVVFYQIGLALLARLFIYLAAYAIYLVSKITSSAGTLNGLVYRVNFSLQKFYCSLGKRLD